MPRVRKKYRSLFKKFSELTRLEGANQYTGGQQDLLASNDFSKSGVIKRNQRWKESLKEAPNEKALQRLRNSLERFIGKEVVLSEFQRTGVTPGIREIDKLMSSAGCPTLQALIYDKDINLFGGSYYNLLRKIKLPPKKESYIKPSQKAP